MSDGSAGLAAAEGRRDGGMALRGKDTAARIRRRGNKPAVSPGFQVLERVDDTPAKLAIGGTGALGPVLLERAIRETEEARRFRRAEKALRHAGAIG
jgi:hypothetical protein